MGAGTKLSPDVAAFWLAFLLINSPASYHRIQSLFDAFKMSSFNVNDVFAPIDKSLKFEIVPNSANKQNAVCNEQSQAVFRRPRTKKLKPLTVQDLFAPIDKSLTYEIVPGSAKKPFDISDKQGGAALTRAQTKKLKLENDEKQHVLIEDDDGDLEDNSGGDFELNGDPSTSRAIEDNDDLESSEPIPSTSRAVDQQSPNLEGREGAEPQPLRPTNLDLSKDTVVVENAAVRAHIFQSFFRRQKIFA